ncbi:type I-F CRISPR-associated protein Csy2 [Desulfurivibrio alkaliphilus]|uniref:CRISPR-associated protein, Csy2 family n=1 Tax=Desulfurivibrio alkaliphilus (strain DSM 19089 / UNIQEM U267 / AHT2) TaxID=589865 RepID=D6Z3U6_DESAT|nr:type I-F CRISPR-associated protein Csy2 [Desulfurivibrio alkaliphilus]ADH86221.1 CRISPR-associated protein, Csy2 family [Desulfurivibrio alkaliphilus AHT 2]
MMDTMLILRNIKVENANAIAGVTWGFPAISNFLGFVHAISRKLPPHFSLQPNGCGIVCHDFQVNAHQPKGWGDYVFALTRNPLTKQGETASFVEEGRMHMDVSMIIPCDGEVPINLDPEEVTEQIEQLLLEHRLAGGTILEVGAIELVRLPEEEASLAKFERRQLRKLLPGFALVQRADLLAQHTEKCFQQNPEMDAMDAWLDFSALKFMAVVEGDNENQDDHSGKVEWQYIPKPGKGWLVPITVGYRGISDLFEPGEVLKARDSSVPFRFVESAYSIGEWLSPHRLGKIQQLVWRYDVDPESGWYLCKNDYQPEKTAN